MNNSDMPAMPINWAEVSKSDGYKSLKAAYVKDISKSGRSKQELYRHFQWVINRAKHYAHKFNCSMEDVLNAWEKKRDYWWLSYYQDSKQPKLHSKSLMPIGERGLKKRKKLRGW